MFYTGMIKDYHLPQYLSKSIYEGSTAKKVLLVNLPLHLHYINYYNYNS